MVYDAGTRGWMGYRKWTTRKHTIEDLKRFARWGAGIGLKMAHCNSADLDTEDAQLANTIVEIITRHCGSAPVRCRDGSPRCLLLYRSDGMQKSRLAWINEGRLEGLEWLGNGNQAVVEGMHKSGVPYKWRAPHPCELGYEALTKVTPEQVRAAFDEVRETMDMLYDVEFVEKKKTTKTAKTSSSTRRTSLDDPSLWAPSPQMVLDALKVFRNTHENVPSHDDFVTVLCSIKASLGPDREQYYPDVLNWALEYEGGIDEEYVRGRWDSIRDSTVGWSYLAAQAQRHGYDGHIQMIFDAPDETSVIIETALERMLKRFVWCSQIERYVDLDTNVTLSAKSFNSTNTAVAEFGCSGRNSAEAIFQNTLGARKADMITYRPGQEPWIEDRNASSKMVPAVNMWRPSDMVAAENITEVDIRPWLNHVELIFGPLDGPAATHFLDCAAFRLQYRGVKINHAILLWGETQGTGKDSVFEPIFRFIGDHNFRKIAPETLAGQFTDYLQCEVVVVEEMMNFEKRATANKMKPHLASPPHTVTVNKKHMAPYTIPNIQWWVIFSNHENAVPIEDTDRRYWVHRCCLETPRDPAYYRELYSFYDKGGVEKIAGWLLARNVEHFNPAAPPPMTDAKQGDHA